MNSSVQLPGTDHTSATTPLKLGNPQVENLQNHNIQHDKKRGPTTPLTPSLLQKNIVKKQYLQRDHPIFSNRESLGAIDLNDAEVGLQQTKTTNEGNVNDSVLNETQGSPKTRKSMPLAQRHHLDDNQQATPKMAKGIKMAVKEHKKSRLQMLRQEQAVGNTSINSDSDYSEVSTISGDTPNYKLNNNLIYHKNGYYIEGDVDDSFYDTAKENIIQSKELIRVNDVLTFITLEKQFDNEEI